MPERVNRLHIRKCKIFVILSRNSNNEAATDTTQYEEREYLSNKIHRFSRLPQYNKIWQFSEANTIKLQT